MVTVREIALGLIILLVLVVAASGCTNPNQLSNQNNSKISNSSSILDSLDTTYGMGFLLIILWFLFLAIAFFTRLKILIFAVIIGFFYIVLVFLGYADPHHGRYLRIGPLDLFAIILIFAIMAVYSGIAYFKQKKEK